VTNPGAGYSITTPAAPFTASVIGTGSTAALGNCIYDFLAIVGATDAITGNSADRFCGTRLNPTPSPGFDGDVQVCSKLNRPFFILLFRINAILNIFKF
jgi:hypothetical protein